MTTAWTLLALPLLLGLVGFVEPCSVGSSLLFVKFLEARSAAAKVRATIVFALARALFLGSMGAAAALVGAAFLDLQRGFWIGLGVLYLAIGAIYLAGRQRWLMRALGRGRVWLDRLASLSARVPRWTGVVFVGLGALSIYFAL